MAKTGQKLPLSMLQKKEHCRRSWWSWPIWAMLLNISHARSALAILYIKLNSKALNETVVCVFACGRPHLSGGLITNWWRVELAWYRLHLIPIRPRGPALYQDVDAGFPLRSWHPGDGAGVSHAQQIGVTIFIPHLTKVLKDCDTVFFASDINISICYP